MERLTIINAYNERLSAYLFKPVVMRYMLIIAHGFRGAKENGGRIFDFAEALNELGIGVLAFDFSGSGQSEGDFSQITLARQVSDLNYVIDYVHAQFGLPLILLGRSFGGSTILAGGSQDERVVGFILWSTPVFLEQSFSTIMPDEYQRLKEGQLAIVKDEAGDYSLGPEIAADFARHDMKTYLRAIGDRPVLIVHARDDEVVDPRNAQYIKDNLKNAHLSLVDNAGHRFLDKTALRESLTMEWLRDNLL